VTVPSQQSTPCCSPIAPTITNKSKLKTYTKRGVEDMEMYRKATKLCLNSTPPQTPEKDNSNTTPTKTTEDVDKRSCSPVLEFAPSNPIIMPKSKDEEGV